MSIDLWEVYMKCPFCGEITVGYDYHENTSSEREEIFEVLNIGRESNHVYLGNPFTGPKFQCSYCGKEAPYSEIFTQGNCTVEDLDVYKKTLIRSIEFADRDGNVCFSDWDPNWGEEPALSRLIAMYPQDAELREIKSIYHRLHAYGKRAVTKAELHSCIVSRDQILVPEVLERVYLGDRVEEIAPHTFENCKLLSDIYIPDSVTIIGECAFSNSELHKIHISDRILHLGRRAFSNTCISRFFFPSGIKTVGEECFMNCHYLNNLWIPSQVSIEKNAFSGCNRLKQIKVPGNTSQAVIDTWGLSEECVVERYTE